MKKRTIIGILCAVALIATLSYAFVAAPPRSISHEKVMKPTVDPANTISALTEMGMKATITYEEAVASKEKLSWKEKGYEYYIYRDIENYANKLREKTGSSFECFGIDRYKGDIPASNLSEIYTKYKDITEKQKIPGRLVILAPSFQFTTGSKGADPVVYFHLPDGGYLKLSEW